MYQTLGICICKDKTQMSPRWDVSLIFMITTFKVIIHISVKIDFSSREKVMDTETTNVSLE